MMARILPACVAIALVSVTAIAARQSSPSSSPERWTPSSISTPGYESSPSFTPDGEEMYFVSADAGFRGWRILRARCEEGRWSRGEPVPFAAPAPVIEADPFVTADGRRIYYVSARHDPTNQDFDIWYVDRSPDGTFGTPHRLPPPVNSPASEILPRADGEGRLYFGSSRPGGFGQSDIYSAVETAPGMWTVENVGPPVSTPANEYEAEVSYDGRTLIVVADRGQRSHLYRFARDRQGWREVDQLPGRDDVFQVGPLLSPKGERLIFAQADDHHSGEMYLVDLAANSEEVWPPSCNKRLPPS